MNKKGFTIIELLAVITILGILLVVIIPSVSSLLNLNNKNYYATQEKNLLNAGRDYFNKNRNLLPKVDNHTNYVDLSQLVNDYIEPIKDSDDKTCSGKVIVKRIGINKYEYFSCISCPGYKTVSNMCN